MKKKFIQTLMLLIVAVSVGSFVSCKDTSEDLYNELRTQSLTENASLKEALDAYEQKLDQQIALYEQLQRELIAIKTDSISKLTALINAQSDLIADLQNDLNGKADQAEVDALKALLDMLKDQINGNEGIVVNLQNLINNDAAQDALIQTLQTEINDLKLWKEQLQEWCDRNNFTDVLDWMNKLQQKMTEAKDKINAAIAKADEAKADAAAAMSMAELAYNNAQNAYTLAQKADQAAAVAKETADKAWELATKALETATSAQNIATNALTLAEANKEDIAALKTLTEELRTLANENKAKIDLNTANIEKNTQDIEKAKADISALNAQIAAMNETLSAMSKDILDAFNKASEAYANASANSLEIAALKELVKNLQSSIDKLQNVADDTDDKIADLLDKINCLSCEMATMETAVAILTASSITHFEAAKCYADQQIAALKTQLLLEIKTMLADYLKTEDIDLSKYVTKEEIQNYVTKVEAANYATKEDLEKYVTEEVLNSLLQALEAKLTGEMTGADAALELALTKLIQEKIDALNIGDLRERIAKNETDIEWLKNLYSEINGKIDNFITKEDFEAWKDQIQGEITSIGNQLGNINNFHVDLSGITVSITTDVMKNLDSKLAILKEELKNELKDEIGAIIDSYNFLTEDDIEGLSEAIATLTVLEEKLKGMEDYADRIKALEDEVKDLAELKAKVNLLESTAITMDDLADYVKEEDLKNMLKDYVKKDVYDAFVTATGEEFKKYLSIDKFNTEKAELLSKINANETEIGKVKSDVSEIKSKIPGMESDIADLKTRMTKTETQLAQLETKMNEELGKIKSDVSAIQNQLAKQVTGIIVQGTRNPMFGTFSIPANIQSNILLAYYGVPVNDIEFPTYKTGLYGGNRADEAFTPEEIDMLKEMGLEVFEAPANLPLLAEEGNAGKVYMTINPNTADLSGLKLSIVNSLDKESPIKLNPIKKSNDKLQFGYSRADNGFYEATAYVTPKTVMTESNGIPLTRQEIKTAFSDVKAKIKDVLNSDEKGDMTIGQLSADVYNVIRDLKADQNGLKCTYTTTEADATEKEHSVYSQYNLAATFLNPLNLNTAKDFNYQTIPGYEKAENLFYKLAGDAKDKVHTFFKELNNSDLVEKISNLTITSIEVADLTEDQLALFKVSIDTTIWITGLKYHLDLNETVNVPVKFTTDVSVPVNIDQDIEIDLSKVTVQNPTIVITTDLKNQDGTATLVVPVKDGDNKVIGNAEVDLSQVKVTADATVGEIKLDGTTVAHLTYNDNVTATITVDETVAATINIDKWIYFGDYELDADGNIVEGGTNTDAKQFHIWVTKDLSDAAESLWGSAQAAIGNVNDMLDDLRDIVREFNNALEKINKYEGKIDSQIDSVVDNYLMKYLDKINTTIVDFVNSFNRRVQPFMVASTSKGFKRVSTHIEYPTLLSSDVTLYPTSKTMELIVPLARKHVAVTNVFSEDLSKSVQAGTLSKSLISDVNTGDLNKVFDGNKRKVNVSGLKTGYVYEIAYSALDFDGNMSTHRYYIKIQ